MELTDKSIRGLPLEGDKGKPEVVYFDDDVKRFGLRIRSTKRTWIIQYRRDGVSKKLTIGDAAVIPAAKARDTAKRRLAEVMLGGDPQDAKQAARGRAAITIKAELEAYPAHWGGRPSGWPSMASNRDATSRGFVRSSDRLK